MFITLILAGCSRDSPKWEDEQYCESLGRAGEREYASEGNCYNTAEVERVRIEREARRVRCQQPEYRNSANCAPFSTPTAVTTPRSGATPRPTATPTESEVFRLWYLANGYPASSFGQAESLVAQACRSLRDGLSGESVALAIATAAEPSLADDIAYILGAGVQALCPDQSHKFR